jgi:hypothetical protein
MPPLTRDDIVKWLEKPSRSFNDQDLTGCDLSGLEITGRDFKRAKLAGARFSGAKFDACDFKQADLTSADLSGATFETCPFPGARLDGATVKDATFEYCEFKGATWTGAVVKRCTFESCDDLAGLAPHKIYRTLSDMPDDDRKLALCRERFAPLQALLGGKFEGSAEDSVCELVGELRGRVFRVKVDLWDGSPTLQLGTRNTGDAWFYVYRDPKRRAKAEARGPAGEKALLHFLSESVYLEEDSREELDACLGVLARLRPDTRKALVEAIESFKLETIAVNDEYIEGEYKKDILVLDLTQSVPLLLDLFFQLAEVVESGTDGSETVAETVAESVAVPVPVTGTVSVTMPVTEAVAEAVAETAPVAEAVAVPGTGTGTGTVSVTGTEAVAVAETAPVAVPVAESPSFDLSKRCRHCGATIPWGEFECPACHKYF